MNGLLWGDARVRRSTCLVRRMVWTFEGDSSSKPSRRFTHNTKSVGECRTRVIQETGALFVIRAFFSLFFGLQTHPSSVTTQRNPTNAMRCIFFVNNIHDRSQIKQRIQLKTVGESKRPRIAQSLRKIGNQLQRIALKRMKWKMTIWNLVLISFGDFHQNQHHSDTWAFHNFISLVLVIGRVRNQKHSGLHSYGQTFPKTNTHWHSASEPIHHCTHNSKDKEMTTTTTATAAENEDEDEEGRNKK